MAGWDGGIWVGESAAAAREGSVGNSAIYCRFCFFNSPEVNLKRARKASKWEEGSKRKEEAEERSGRPSPLQPVATHATEPRHRAHRDGFSVSGGSWAGPLLKKLKVNRVWA